jgi:hypothetical protein
MTLITIVIALTLSGAQSGATVAPQRFDYLVRADFFAGLAGMLSQHIEEIAAFDEGFDRIPALCVWTCGEVLGARASSFAHLPALVPRAIRRP